MAMEHNPSGRRPNYHRGRRGTDRRGNDRRTPQQGPEQGGRPSGDQVDVEQIMREIRARISQRHGIELSPQQIQDLAARRLEAILDPRTVSPTLMDQLRKGASAGPDPLSPGPDTEYSFSENAIYESDSGLLRFFRRLLNPLLKLFFNPAPIIAALQAQARINRDAAARIADAERRQTEWNALHYQILQRLVTEVSRVSIEMQALNGRIESLAARVDFNDRRVRSFETTASRNQRAPESAPVSVPAEKGTATAEGVAPPIAGTQPSSDGPRRRRRRRRGRRGSLPGTESSIAALPPAGAESPDDADLDDGDDEQVLEAANGDDAVEVVAAPALAADPVPPGESAPVPPSPPESVPLPPPQPTVVSFVPQPAEANVEAPAAEPPEPADPEPSDR